METEEELAPVEEHVREEEPDTSAYSPLLQKFMEFFHTVQQIYAIKGTEETLDII